MIVMGVETSGRAASVCVIDDDKVLFQTYSDCGLTHGKEIVPMIKYTLEKCGKKAEDIDLFAGSKGPGSFTGIRIGIAAVKALAWVSGKPCVGVSSLRAMAYNVQAGEDEIICTVTDARGGRVYNSMLKYENGEIVTLSEDRVVLLDDLTSEMKSGKQKYLLVGDGARMCYNEIREQSVNIKLAMDNVVLPNAFGVAKAGLYEFCLGNAVTPHELLPNYLVKCQAEREFIKKQQQA